MNIEVNERPPVTFVLFAYNQERFIREAIEGAFSQTYSPLEIILTDDCSTDHTFSIMQQMAAAYNGPHTVHLNRPPANRGLSAQIDANVKLAKTEWVVVAAGDDISLPDRVAQHMEIARSHPDAYSSFLAPLPFGGSVEGRVPTVSDRVIRYPESLQAHGGGVLGATHAFRAVSWNVFGDLGSGVICEDWVIPFRSSLLGTVVWSECPAVRFRVHGNSVTADYWGQPGRTLPSGKQIRMESNALDMFKRDLQTAKVSELIRTEEVELGLDWISRARTTNNLILGCIEARNRSAWLRASIALLACNQFIGNYRRRISLIWRTFFQHQPKQP